MELDYKKGFKELVERVRLKLEEVDESVYGCLIEDNDSDEVQFYNGMRSAYDYINNLAILIEKGKVKCGS